jgi:tetratricopeptide (TPR) repeat protein
MFRRLDLAIILVSVSLAAAAQETGEPEDAPGILDQAVPVADEPSANEVADADAGTDDTVPTEDEVLREFERFQQLLEEQNFDEADNAAKRIVQMSIQIYGPQSHETAKALNNLAIVQHNNKQYDAAIQNFNSAIEILEVIEDRLNAQLVNPLRGLGAAQLGSGRPDLASQSFGRATHITHVNEGPHNIDQIEILEAMAEANVRLGDVEAARDILDRIHILNVRHFQDDAMGLLPSLMRRASWQHRAGYYNDERATYRRAVRIVEESAGKDDPRLIDPLLRLGKSFYYYQSLTEDTQRSYPGSAELYFKRAARIADSAPGLPWLDRVTAKLALADHYISSDSFNRARRLYKETWDILSGDEERLDMRAELFGAPMPVWKEPIPSTTNAAGAAGRRSNDKRSGTVTVSYTVSERGRISGIRSEANPPQFTDMLRMVHREIRRRVFRPQIIDGEPVDSAELEFRHEFVYLQSELDDLTQKADETEAKASTS